VRAWGGLGVAGWREEGEQAQSQRRRHGELADEPDHMHTIVIRGAAGDGARPISPGTLSTVMSPTWIWTQIAIVVFVLIGMIVAITKLA
jgi:hypothetical protein